MIRHNKMLIYYDYSIHLLIREESPEENYE